MPTVWRQGDLLAPDDAIALGVIEPGRRDTHRVLVVSHSCDISSPEKTEPFVEVVVGELLHVRAGAHSHRRAFGSVWAG